ncbi:helix-turn-helix domain-containing protein [Pectobacterium actinidiae]|uniref:Helix-turn-helix domain-containing protein n=1 Tax=Pectobacterium actinidiae TaxID=1507808 RepID=A0ABW8G5Y5_9GAMM
MSEIAANNISYLRSTSARNIITSQGLLSAFKSPTHYHEDYHIGVVSTGHYHQHSRFGSGVLFPGHFCIMPPDEPHSGIVSNTARCILHTIRIPSDSMGLLTDTPEKKLPFNGKTFSSQLIYNLLLEYLSIHTPCYKDNSQNDFLCIIIEAILNKHGKLIESIKKNNNFNIEKLKFYCIENLSEKIDIDSMSKFTGIGKFEFIRKFSRQVGMTPYSWLNSIKAEQAFVMIKTTNKPLIEVSSALGFYDQSHFSHFFKRYFSIPPAELRRQLKEPKS